jgi:hypothetical protein
MSYPDDVRPGATGRTPTLGDHHDPVVVQHDMPPADVRTARLPEDIDAHRDRDGDRGRGHDGPDVVERFTPVLQRTKLLVAIAAMTALTLLLSLITLLTLLSRDGGSEPVLVDGVPCLVEEGEGDTEQAVLYCQR